MKEPLRNWSRLRSWCLLSEDAAGEVSVAVEDDGKGWDSVEVLGPDIMMEVMKLLDAHRVACSIVVSRGWYHVATIDRLWNPGEQETSFNCLRQGKVIPTSTPTLCEELWKERTRPLFIDGLRSKQAGCTNLQKEDLCDHASDFTSMRCSKDLLKRLKKKHGSINLKAPRIRFVTNREYPSGSLYGGP
ncbi:hypothetical protein HPP92_022683 [Vanilla planifolia]|uniref:F-box domain-containing protein n=1 Tax=Vanilla planifolia TaxID=51239 RepID=A0A835UFJ5_VANPL|nr:hypothetical protein HPP92_022683 [Vanilla planifolia]